MAHAATSVLSISPSFTSCSSSSLADIAARVVEEFRNQEEGDEEFGFGFGVSDEDFYDEFAVGSTENEVKFEKIEDFSGDNEQRRVDEEELEEGEEGEEFEFAFFPKDSIPSPAPADEIFYNGQIRPVYPLFDTSLLYEGVGREKCNENLRYNHDEATQKPTTVRLPLRKLFTEERQLSNSSSCSSSEADEVDGAAPGTYCVWNPKAVVVEAKRQCKKSNSTGSSKRWRFRDLLYRSNSDGSKERFISVNQSNRDEKVEKFDKNAKLADKINAAQPCGKISCDRRRESYLPYRQELVGIFTNVYGFSRN